MQFNSNSDFPGQNLPKDQWSVVSRPPIPFDPAEFVPCACITTRILVNVGNTLAAGLGDDVLATMGQNQMMNPHIISIQGVNYLVQTARNVIVQARSKNLDQGAINWSDSSDSSSIESELDDTTPKVSQHVEGNLDGLHPIYPERAYWLRHTLRSAIYGRVCFGIVLQKISPPVQFRLPGASSDSELVNVEWETTTETVAIKEMNWDQIRTQGHNLAENPVKEIAAMQHLKRWFEREGICQKKQKRQQQQIGNINNQLNRVKVAHHSVQPGMLPLNGVTSVGSQHQSTAASSMLQQYSRPHSMFETHVMTSLEALSDGKNIYSVMPYFSGGELYQVLQRRTKFSECEARFWFHQLLEGLSTLKAANLSHRDLSLENLMLDGDNVIIIDMGMCLRVPVMNPITKERFLITPQGTCGKWQYMSPEICNGATPFDGHAVDLWAVGVILFIMLTGYPPWEKAVLTDERFKFMANGYLVNMLTEWKTGLSGDAMDLLQRMFWLDPIDRLSLEQVWAHPWTQKKV